jgi:hypothetical protein
MASGSTDVAVPEDDLTLPSDTEAALDILLRDCPPGSRVGDAKFPCAISHSLYSVVHHSTEVDLEIERLRLSNAIRVMKLPAHGDERLLIRAADYTSALQASGCEGAADLAAALPQCTGLMCRRLELEEAMGGKQVAARAIIALVKSAWLVPAAREAHAQGPDEAPGDGLADAWLWHMPQAGHLLYRLNGCRGAVMQVLHRQKFHRCLRHALDRDAAVLKALRDAKLDLRYVLRDMIGKRLIKRTDTMAGCILELSPAGVQAANARNAGRKRRR